MYWLYLTSRQALSFLPDLSLFCMFCLAITLKFDFFNRCGSRPSVVGGGPWGPEFSHFTGRNSIVRGLAMRERCGGSGIVATTSSHVFPLSDLFPTCPLANPD